MKKLRKLCTLAILAITCLIGIVGCNRMNNEYDLDNFKKEMKSRGYEYEMQNLEEALFTPISQYMLLNDSILVDGKQVLLYDTDVVIYSYKDNEAMEKEASTLSEDASQIIRGETKVECTWPKTAHFYKKGKIIVRYIGEDKQIITDLNEIMGTPFAGN